MAKYNYKRNRRRNEGNPKNKIFTAILFFVMAFTLFNSFFFLKFLFLALGGKNAFEYFQERKFEEYSHNDRDHREESSRRYDDRDRRSRRFEERYEEPKGPPVRNRHQAPKRSSNSPSNKAAISKNLKEKEKFLKEGKILFNNFAYEEAAEKFKLALKFAPNDVAVNFNLACSFSLLEKADLSLKHLNAAIVNGFKDVEKIESHDALAFLRITDEYAEFKSNGYKLKGQFDNNLLEKLEKLKNLRDQGILTEIEFLQQKEKLLKN